MAHPAQHPTIAPAGTTVGRPSTRMRWLVWALLVVATALNFADRAVFGLTAKDITAQLHLTTSQYGLAASAFNWGYTATLFVAGALIIRIGPRRTIVAALAVWALFVTLTPFAPTIVVLIIFRILFGVGEAANFPSTGAFIGQWFPARERNFAGSLVSVGEGLGSVVFVPLATAVLVAFGWQAPYIMLGICALIWLVFGIWLLRDRPSQSSRVGKEELLYITEGAGKAAGEVPFRARWREILTNPTLWGAALASWGAAYMIYFALTFLPLYLENVQHLPKSALASFGVVPWIAFVIGAVIGARVSDLLYRKYRSLRIARGFLGSLVLVFVAAGAFVLPSQANSVVGAEITLALVMLLVGWANGNLLILAVDCCPQDASRSTGIVFGVTSSSGIVAPIVTGYFVEATGSYDSAFVFAGAVCLVCAVIALILVRDGHVISPRAVDAPAAKP